MTAPVKSLPRSQVEEIFRVLRNLVEMSHNLGGDVERGSRELIANSSDPFLRRNLVRMFAAYVEGNSYILKQVVLKLHDALQLHLDADDLSKLHEQKCDGNGNMILDAQGQPKRRFLPLLDNQKFAAALFTQLCGSRSTINYGVSGYETFRRMIGVRDRLMHPKCIRDLDVSDAETRDLQEAWQWYQKEMGKLLADSTAAIELRFATILART